MTDKKISELNAASTIGDSDDFAVVQDAETKQVNASVIKTYASTAPTIVGGTINSASVGATTPSTGNFTTLGTTGNVTLGDSSGDTVTLNSGTVTLNNSTTISAASTKTLTLNGGGGTNGLVIDASNNVGIGTISPAAKLGVGGNVFFGNQTTTATTISTLRFTSTASANFIQSGSTTSSGSAQPLIFGSIYNWATWLTLDAAGNLGLGVTPSAWGYATKALQLASGSLATNGTNYLDLFQNVYDDGTSKKYVNTGYASQYRQTSGTHNWYTAVSGTAGNTISFTTAMTLDASGYLGLGVTPTYRLDVSSAGSAATETSLRLTNPYTSGGAVAATNLLFGYHSGYGYRQSAKIEAGQQYAGNFSYGYLAFFTQSADGVLTEAGRFDSSGNLLVGDTSSPIAAKIMSKNTVGYYCYVSNAANHSGGYYHIAFLAQGTQVGSITSNATNTAYNQSSDIRLKTDLGPATKTSVIDDTVIHDFEWKSTGTKARGVFAQEAQKVNPNAVTPGQSDELNEDGTPVHPWGVDYSKYVPDLIVYCQQLRAEIETLKERIK